MLESLGNNGHDMPGMRAEFDGGEAMKYIVIDMKLAGETMVIFPDHIKHKRMAQGACDCENHPVSAGFITLRDGKFTCYDESISLDLKSRPEDSALANRMFGRT
jgi:hypothetical protein